MSNNLFWFCFSWFESMKRLEKQREFAKKVYKPGLPSQLFRSVQQIQIPQYYEIPKNTEKETETGLFLEIT